MSRGKKDPDEKARAKAPRDAKNEERKPKQAELHDEAAGNDEGKAKVAPDSPSSAGKVGDAEASGASQDGDRRSPDEHDGAANDEAIQDVQKLEEQVKELTDRLQRKAAEFANYQKRIQKEMIENRKFAAQPLILEFLSVLDNFERALEAGEQCGTDDGATAETELLQGVRMIHDQLKVVLDNAGVVPIESLDKLFDPNCHDAIMEEINPDLPDKTIVDELVRGYMLHDRLLRPARVRVSRAAKNEATPAPKPAPPKKEQRDDSRSPDEGSEPPDDVKQP